MKELLTETKALMNHIFWFEQDISRCPDKNHYGTAINYTDIRERKTDFLKELVNTVTSWVYSHQKCKEIIEERSSVTKDYGNAATFLTTQAFSKFRPGHPQGQFGELLLFNFIQHFYKAVPLLRKQRITTSTGHERFGADAIHYKKENDHNILIIGESKCYMSEYKFKQAFQVSLESIVTSFNDIDKELDLYIYDDFVEPELESVAKQYKVGILPNVEYDLVCMIAYNEHRSLTGENEKAIKEEIKITIKEQLKSLAPETFTQIDRRILNRINFIVFPLWDIKELLDQFQRKVGSSV